MEPALGMGVLWLLFAGTHIGLATHPVRGALVARLGERGFGAFFSLVASVAYTVIVSYYAAHRFAGAPGLALGHVPALRWPLMAIVAAGVALTIGALAAYPRSPMAMFSTKVPAPRGIGRITRHAFFVGVALVAAAHVLLATRLVGTVFMGGFGLLALAGAWHQDRKLLHLRGEPYADYLAATSVMPFAAVIGGRQRVVWGELPWASLAAGLAIAVLLRAVHASIFAHGGAWVVGVTLAGAALATLGSWRRARRRRTADARVAHAVS